MPCSSLPRSTMQCQKPGSGDDHTTVIPNGLVLGKGGFSLNPQGSLFLAFLSSCSDRTFSFSRRSVSWLFVRGNGCGSCSPASSGPDGPGAFSGAVTFVNASLPLPLPADDVACTLSILPQAWKEAAVGTAALDLRERVERSVSERWEARVLSINLARKLGSTSCFDGSGCLLAEPSGRSSLKFDLEWAPVSSRSDCFNKCALDGGFGDGRLRCLEECGLTARDPIVNGDPWLCLAFWPD